MNSEPFVSAVLEHLERQLSFDLKQPHLDVHSLGNVVVVASFVLGSTDLEQFEYFVGFVAVVVVQLPFEFVLVVVVVVEKDCKLVGLVFVEVGPFD